jgi:hypothetical protein
MDAGKGERSVLESLRCLLFPGSKQNEGNVVERRLVEHDRLWM